MMNTETKWVCPRPIDIEKYVGFIYLVTFDDGYWYVGRKMFWSTTRKKVPGKVRMKVTVKESNWHTYPTSSDHVKKRLETCEADWTILHLCESKADMSYLEPLEILTRRSGRKDPLALNKRCPQIRNL